MKTLHSAQEIHRDQSPEGTYGDLAALGQVELIDQVLAAGQKQGYTFTLTLHQAPPRITSLKDPESALLIDEILRSSPKSGYDFESGPGTASDGSVKVATKKRAPVYWSATAVPVEPGESGHRSFYTDSTGVIRYSMDGPANQASPSLNDF